VISDHNYCSSRSTSPVGAPYTEGILEEWRKRAASLALNQTAAIEEVKKKRSK